MVYQVVVVQHIGVRPRNGCKELGGWVGPRCHHAPVSTPRGSLVQLVKGRPLHWGPRTSKQHTRGGSQAFLPCLESNKLKNKFRLLRRMAKPEQIQAVWRASPAPPRWSPWSWTCTSPGTSEHQRESRRTEVHGDVLLQLLHGCDCGFLLQLLLVSRKPSCCEALVPSMRVFKQKINLFFSL